MYSHKACDLNGKQTWCLSLDAHTHPDEALHPHQQEWLKHPLDVCWVETDTKISHKYCFTCFHCIWEIRTWPQFVFFFVETEVKLKYMYSYTHLCSLIKFQRALCYHTSTASSAALSSWWKTCRLASGGSWINESSQAESGEENIHTLCLLFTHRHPGSEAFSLIWWALHLADSTFATWYQTYPRHHWMYSY